VRWPGESDEYRRARDELLQSEIDLRRREEAVAAQRRALPLGGEVPQDYMFDGADGEVRLSELFADGKDTLFLYSFMFIPDGDGDPLGAACPSCTSIIDSMDGAARHLTQRINFAVSAKVPIDRFQGHARTRGWRHARLLSSARSTYTRDYNAESEDGAQWPIASVFVRHDATIRHFWSSELFDAATDPGQHPRHVDFMWPMWATLDRTPEGRGSDWGPQLEYT
jgi:predicted dithiol-disulfide oxidoreductase (DUF899 family)